MAPDAPFFFQVVNSLDGECYYTKAGDFEQFDPHGFMAPALIRGDQTFVLTVEPVKSFLRDAPKEYAFEKTDKFRERTCPENSLLTSILGTCLSLSLIIPQDSIPKTASFSLRPRIRESLNKQN